MSPRDTDGRPPRRPSKGVVRFGALFYLKKYAPNFLRLGAFLVFVYLVALVVAGQMARAQVSEALMGMGVEMLRYEGAVRQEAPRTLSLNGQPIRLASGLTEHTLDQVLDYYEARCMEHDGRFAEQIREIADGSAHIEETDGELFDATLRERNGNRGFVACLDTGTERLDTDGVVERLQRFRETLDLSEFGDMRYIYAEEGDGTTMFVAFWTEGSFKVLDMFPPEGDAPGVDVDDVPRPPSSRRILSAWEEGMPESVTMYSASPLDPDGLEAFYREQMPEAGWHLLELPDSVMAEVPADRQVDHFLVYEKAEEDRMVTLVFSTDTEGLGTATVLTHR